MNIFFDIDQTLIEPSTRQLRPWSEWCIKHLQEYGHEIFLWSHVGWTNCVDVGLKMQIARWKWFTKPGLDNMADHSHIVDQIGNQVKIDLCIDDDPTDMPNFYQGMTVLPYFATYDEQIDQEMLRILDCLAPGTDQRKKAKAYDAITDKNRNPV